MKSRTPPTPLARPREGRNNAKSNACVLCLWSVVMSCDVLLWVREAACCPCSSCVFFFLSLLRVSADLALENLCLCRLCQCRFPFLSNVLFVPKRRQPGVRENLFNESQRGVAFSSAAISARRFAGEWTQITTLSTSLLPTPACFLAFVFPFCFNLWCSLATVHSCMPMHNISIPPNKHMVHKWFLLLYAPENRLKLCLEWELIIADSSQDWIPNSAGGLRCGEASVLVAHLFFDLHFLTLSNCGLVGVEAQKCDGSLAPTAMKFLEGKFDV